MWNEGKADSKTLEQVEILQRLMLSLSNSALYISEVAHNLNSIQAAHTDEVKDAARFADDIVDLAHKVEEVLEKKVKDYLNSIK